MDLYALRDYNSWRRGSAEEILAAVNRVGGWKFVFPDGVPLWAHRVRNFFNREPRRLTRFSADIGHEYLALIHSGLGKLGSRSDIDEIVEKQGLSGDVYRDEFGHTWYQMSPGATIYHWGKDPTWAAPLEAVMQTGGQVLLPVFKLVAPDGTGGSRETIIKNPQTISIMNQRSRRETVSETLIKPVPLRSKAGQPNIGEEFKSEPVAHLIVDDLWHQGSYNYSETVIVGRAAHEKRDVQPHKKYPYRGIYVNPQDRFSSLALRRFPEYGDVNERNPLAKQV